MSTPSAETQAKVASDAAQNFVEHYYDSLNKKHSLSHYYASGSARLTAAGVKPDISINGNVCATLREYEALLEAQGGPVHYECVSFDAHPVNPNYSMGGATESGGGGGGREGDRLSFAVQVSGTVRYGRGDGAEERAFHEGFLMVPNPEAGGRNAPRGVRKWVIASQNFRVL